MIWISTRYSAEDTDNDNIAEAMDIAKEEIHNILNKYNVSIGIFKDHNNRSKIMLADNKYSIKLSLHKE